MKITPLKPLKGASDFSLAASLSSEGRLKKNIGGSIQQYFNLERNRLEAARLQQQKEDEERRKQQQSKGLLQRIGGFTESIRAGEADRLRPIATGVARMLPGGQADIQARQRGEERLNKTREDLLRVIRDKSIPKNRRDIAAQALTNLDKESTGAVTQQRQRLETEGDTRRVLASAASLGLLAATGATGRLAGVTKAAPTFRAGQTANALRTGRIATRGPISQQIGSMTGRQVARASGVLGVEGAAGGVADELTREDPTLRGAVTSAAITGGLAGAIPVAGSLLSQAGRGLKSGRTARLDRKIESLQDIGKTPDTPDTLADSLIATAKLEKDKYKRGVIQKFSQGIKETLNPTVEFRRIDSMKQRLAQQQGKKWVRGVDDLESAYDKVNVARTQAQELYSQKLSTGDTLEAVFQRHAQDADNFNVYRNALADLQARARTKGKVKFQRELTDEQLQGLVADYERLNPTARRDIKTINEAINKARKLARESGAISEDLDTKLGDSPFYTPVATAQPDGVPRAKIGGRSATSGKQTFIKEATGADAKLVTTFDPIINYIEGAYKNSAQAKLSQLILDAHEKGLIKGSRVVSEPGAKMAKTDLRSYAQSVSSEAKRVARDLKFTKKEARALQSEISKFNKEGLEVRLKDGGKTPLPEFNVENLGLLSQQKGKSRTAQQFFKNLIEADPANIDRIKAKIALREPRLAAKLDEIRNIQDDLSSLKSEARGARQATFEIVDDPQTGLSAIKGLDTNGQPFTLEVPPEITKLVRGTDITPNNPIMKALLDVQRGFQTTWTGFVNPIFNFVTAPLYDVAANVNALIDNPQAFARGFTPDAFKKTLTGLKNSDVYQTQLRGAGAIPQGGSMLPQDVAKGLEAIMSRGSIKGQTGYLVKNPMEAIKVLDQFSGKLGNATRTRISRGYYQAAKKRGLSDTEALAEAAYAFNNMAPNFNRVTELTRNANAFIPYFGAGIAGNRAMWQPILKNPGRAAAVYGGIAASFMGATAHNLSNDAGQRFYQEMLNSDNQYVLDNNYIIVLPNASKNEETGEWSGIIKIPIAPEYRNINRLALQSTQQAIRGESRLNPMMVAGAIFNTMTGGAPESVVQGPAALRTAQVLAGAKTRGSFLTPEPLVTGQMTTKPKSEQMYPWTSNPAKFFSDITGNRISPIQADEIIRQFGSLGRGATGTGLMDQLRGRFTGARTESLPQQIYTQSNTQSSGLSDRMRRDAGTDINKARQIADEHNIMIQGLMEQIKRSNMSQQRKDEELEKLEKRKASTADHALKSRLKLD